MKKIPILLLIGAIVYSGLNTLFFIKDFSVAIHKSQIETQLSATKSELSNDKAALSTLTNIDQSVKPIVDYITGATSNNLVVSSIDTPNMLTAVKSSSTATTGNKIVTSNGNVSEPSSSQTSSESTSSTATTSSDKPVTTAQKNAMSAQSNATKAENQKTNKVTYGLNDLIIRGYAVDQHSVTDFYNGLSKLKCIKNVEMKGVEEITLPNKETILMYEIEVTK